MNNKSLKKLILIALVLILAIYLFDHKEIFIEGFLNGIK